jgi:hypothetical protein
MYRKFNKQFDHHHQVVSYDSQRSAAVTSILTVSYGGQMVSYGGQMAG